ncbi:MAG: hypothetical protein GX640_09505, partial [Fibrobacter sp.]|nr:hypothetical protein [Fibrobacter sp.]
MERPAYLAALQAFSIYEPKFHQVHFDRNGPLPDMMQILASQNNFRFFYTCPTFQNPTGISYSRERRIEIAELLNRYNIL